MNAEPDHGLWRITSMEVWDQGYVDLVLPGDVEFDNVDGGHLRRVVVGGPERQRFARHDGRTIYLGGRERAPNVWMVARES